VSKYYSQTLSCGVTLLGEEMEAVNSVAVSVLVPVGAATDPAGLEGAANVLSEMLHRGAGPYDKVQLSAEYEKLGTVASHSSGVETSSIGVTLLSENLPKAIELICHTLRRPHLPESELENATQLALQELKSLEDEPSSKVMVELAADLYSYPFGRCQLGTADGIGNLTASNIKSYFQEQFVPSGVLIGVAGKFSWDEVVRCFERELGDWSGSKELLPSGTLNSGGSTRHIYKDTNQLQIALAYPSVSFEHPDFYKARLAVNVLSGGMAGRLFIEVREKRGLVYRVSASHSATRGRAAVFCYAGTTLERSQETLDVMFAELNKLKEGILAEELQRAKADLKSKLILSSESSSARASVLVSDFWNLNRVRTVEEIRDSIDAVTAEDIIGHLHDFPVSNVALVTLGQKGLELPKC
jgi:predicted Zn-dependent peptidase